MIAAIVTSARVRCGRPGCRYRHAFGEMLDYTDGVQRLALSRRWHLDGSRNPPRYVRDDHARNRGFPPDDEAQREGNVWREPAPSVRPTLTSDPPGHRPIYDEGMRLSIGLPVIIECPGCRAVQEVRDTRHG